MAKRYSLRQEEELPLRTVCLDVVNMLGKRPSVKAVWNAIQMVELSQASGEVPTTNYANCGRRPKLSLEQDEAVVAFVKKWRNKRFCTCRWHIVFF